jgi:hypothetical protein
LVTSRRLDVRASQSPREPAGCQRSQMGLGAHVDTSAFFSCFAPCKSVAFWFASYAMRSRQAHLGAPASCRLFFLDAKRGDEGLRWSPVEDLTCALRTAQQSRQDASAPRWGSALMWTLRQSSVVSHHARALRSGSRRTASVVAILTWERRHPAGSFPCCEAWGHGLALVASRRLDVRASHGPTEPAGCQRSQVGLGAHVDTSAFFGLFAPCKSVAFWFASNAIRSRHAHLGAPASCRLFFLMRSVGMRACVGRQSKT